MEVRVPKASSYSQLVNHALKFFYVEKDEEEEGEAPSMFRIDGTMVPESMTSHGLWQVYKEIRWVAEVRCRILLQGYFIMFQNICGF